MRNFSNGVINLPVHVLTNGDIEFDAEQVALGLDLTKCSKGKSYVRWERVNEYLKLSKSGQPLKRGDFITEPQFYRLAFKANNKTTEKFQEWVSKEVLPSIRKYGMYMTDNKAYAVTHDPEALSDLLLQAGNQLKQKELIINEMKPKVDYMDTMLANPGLETITMIAKNYGFAAPTFNEILHGFGIQYKQGDTWLLYAKYQDKGYTQIEPHSFVHSSGIRGVSNTMKWTQKGQHFLYEFLKVKGILPLVEQSGFVGNM